MALPARTTLSRYVIQAWEYPILTGPAIRWRGFGKRGRVKPMVFICGITVALIRRSQTAMSNKRTLTDCDKPGLPAAIRPVAQVRKAMCGHRFDASFFPPQLIASPSSPSLAGWQTIRRLFERPILPRRTRRRDILRTIEKYGIHRRLQRVSGRLDFLTRTSRILSAAHVPPRKVLIAKTHINSRSCP
jgi:hypothetical protein